MISTSTIAKKLQALNTEEITHWVDIHISGDVVQYDATREGPNIGIETDTLHTEHDLLQWLEPTIKENS